MIHVSTDSLDVIVEALTKLRLKAVKNRMHELEQDLYEIEMLVFKIYDTTVDVNHAMVDTGNNLSIADTERNLLIQALEKHQGHREKAARELGISMRTVYRKINQYDIEI